MNIFRNRRIDNAGRGGDLIINGNFDIWQRGTSQTTSGYGSADRWRLSAAANISRQAFPIGQTDVPNNPDFFARVATTTANTFLTQRIEGVRTLAGQTGTVSVWLRSESGADINVSFNQNFGTGGSAQRTVPSQTINVSTQWQKYDITFDIPSITGMSVGANDYLELLFTFPVGSFDIAQVKLEKGNTATPFVPNFPFAELALCLRYCSPISPGARLHGVNFDNQIFVSVPVSVPMRTTPVVTGGLSLNIRFNGTLLNAVSMAGIAVFNRLTSVDIRSTTTSSVPNQTQISASVWGGLTNSFLDAEL